MRFLLAAVWRISFSYFEFFIEISTIFFRIFLIETLCETWHDDPKTWDFRWHASKLSCLCMLALEHSVRVWEFRNGVAICAFDLIGLRVSFTKFSHKCGCFLRFGEVCKVVVRTIASSFYNILPIWFPCGDRSDFAWLLLFLLLNQSRPLLQSVFGLVK